MRVKPDMKTSCINPDECSSWLTIYLGCPKQVFIWYKNGTTPSQQPSVSNPRVDIMRVGVGNPTINHHQFGQKCLVLAYIRQELWFARTLPHVWERFYSVFARFCNMSYSTWNPLKGVVPQICDFESEFVTLCGNRLSFLSISGSQALSG